MMEEYQSFVLGKLLYYLVKVRPDCANAIRDLAQYIMSSPGADLWKSME